VPTPTPPTSSNVRREAVPGGRSCPPPPRQHPVMFDGAAVPGGRSCPPPPPQHPVMFDGAAVRCRAAGRAAPPHPLTPFNVVPPHHPFPSPRMEAPASHPVSPPLSAPAQAHAQADHRHLRPRWRVKSSRGCEIQAAPIPSIPIPVASHPVPSIPVAVPIPSIPIHPSIRSIRLTPAASPPTKLRPAFSPT
jgi:hypothetical protein